MLKETILLVPEKAAATWITPEAAMLLSCASTTPGTSLLAWSKKVYPIRSQQHVPLGTLARKQDDHIAHTSQTYVTCITDQLENSLLQEVQTCISDLTVRSRLNRGQRVTHDRGILHLRAKQRRIWTPWLMGAGMLKRPQWVPDQHDSDAARRLNWTQLIQYLQKQRNLLHCYYPMHGLYNLLHKCIFSNTFIIFSLALLKKKKKRVIWQSITNKIWCCFSAPFCRLNSQDWEKLSVDTKFNAELY